MKLTAQHTEHVHPGERLALQKHGNVFLIHFDAHRFVDRDRIGLMGRLFQHRSESKELPVRRFVDPHFLVLLVDSGYSYSPRHHHVCPPGGIANFVDALPRRERPDLDLPGQHRGFFLIEQRKEWNVFQYLRVACHSNASPTEIRIARKPFTAKVTRKAARTQRGSLPCPSLRSSRALLSDLRG